MVMPGRKYPAGGGLYRYGFNGKEQDKETTGTSTYDYGFRIYNPALGRFLSVDPLQKKFPELTPYQFASNTPIQAVDLDGREGIQYLETITNNGVSTVQRVVEVDVYVAVSRSKDAVHFYSKNPTSDAKIAGGVISDLKKEYKDNKFKDDQGNNVVWRFNVKTFEVDAAGTIDTKHSELSKDPSFKVTPEGGGAFQYRGVIVQQQHISDQVMPTEPTDIPVFEDGNFQRGFDVSVNNQYYSQKEQSSHTLGHEIAHFLLRLHPSSSVRDPDNTPAGHSGAGGGILNYGTAEFRYPRQIRSGNEQITVSFNGLKPLSQTNVTNILKSVPQSPATPAAATAAEPPK
jgi:RHS repeat-associated protein